MDAVLGLPLHEATVTDSTILGGRTMRAYQADWSALGSGEAPWTRVAAPIVDSIDVADLQSEADHGYELLGARDNEQVAHRGISPAGATIVDGGRTQRERERFVARLREGTAAHGIVRLDGPPGSRVRILANGAPIATFAVGDDEDWSEHVFDVPASAATARTQFDLQADPGPITTYHHYWFIDSP